MAITDSLAGNTGASFDFEITRTSGGELSGKDKFKNAYTQAFTQGSGDGQASIVLSGSGTVTQAAAITLSLADSANPLSTFSNEVPNADPEGKKVRMIFIKNEDTTNYIYISQGANAFPDINTTRIYPTGFYLLTYPNGGTVINDGVDDEMTIRADTADCEATITIVYG